MRTRELYLTSSTKVDRIHVSVWLPDQEPDVVVQLVHGMVEHIGRYDAFARFLCSQGIGVIGHDHLGHGKTVAGSSQYGYFAKHHGQKAVLGDMRIVNRYIRKLYPDCRLFLFGHSMGSLFCRRYMTLYGKRLAGVILSGTGHFGRILTGAGKFAAGFIAVTKGDFYRSSLLHRLSTGDYGRYFEEEECKSWLTRDQEQADRYEKDPMCQFVFTASAYHQFFALLNELARKKDYRKIPKDLPLLLISGENDPVGDFGKGVRMCYEEYVRLGMKDVRMKLYPQARHELLNETNRDEVYEEILTWILDRV